MGGGAGRGSAGKSVGQTALGGGDLGGLRRHLQASSITMGNYQKQLNACQTQLSPTGNISFSAGKASGAGLVLSKPGAGNSGSVDLSFNAGSTASGTTCVSASATPATAANRPWFAPNQGGRATFGVFKSPIIYSRENY